MAHSNSIKAIKNSQIENVSKHWVRAWLLYVIKRSDSFLITDESYELTDSEKQQFDNGVQKMQQGIPLAYLIGQQEFWSLDFKVNEHTLIPRPDTEVLVEKVLNWINAQPVSNNNKRLLDLGTGSGCIAISLAHELKQDNWQVVAVDLSLEALDVARHNAALNSAINIEFIQSSWYQALPTGDEHKFDVIVSNPPYIDEADEHLKDLVAEPLSALSAPNHGLADIEQIVQQASNYLYKNGLLAIEHGYDQGALVRQLFLNYGFESVVTVQDYGGNDRVTLGQSQ